VLPFQNLSSDPEQEYFADGIVEDIITALSRFKNLAVVSQFRLRLQGSPNGSAWPQPRSVAPTPARADHVLISK
jgi:TolB-like protein